MQEYKVTTSPDALTRGAIIVEQPHRGPQRVWFACSEEDAIRCTNEAAVCQDTDDYDMETFEGCMEWNGHDLSSQRVLRQEDVDAECLRANSKVAQAAVSLGWAEEVCTEDEE